MRSRQDGFTLVEILAVLVVLAIVGAVAAASLSARRGGDVLQATAYELASRYRAARAAAIRHAASRTVVIDMARRQVSAGVDIAPLRIPDTVSVTSQMSASEQRAPKSAGIRFLPNGASTGGKVRLETGRQAYEVRVNWLTGRVVVERVS
jgi:general secretion pathway protein H